MKFGKNDVKYIIPFLLLVGIGICGSFYFPFHDVKTALALTRK